VKLGDVPPGYYDQHFVYECRRTAKAEDYGLLMDTITRRVNWLREHDRMDQETPQADVKHVNALAEKANEFVGDITCHSDLEGVEDFDQWIINDDMGFYKGQWKKNSNIREGNGLLL